MLSSRSAVWCDGSRVTRAEVRGGLFGPGLRGQASVLGPPQSMLNWLAYTKTNWVLTEVRLAHSCTPGATGALELTHSLTSRFSLHSHGVLPEARHRQMDHPTELASLHEGP